MTVAVAKLVRMAEQIAANLAYTDDAELISTNVASHLNRFWDPRMRRALADFAAAEPAALSPALALAIPHLNDTG